MFSYKELGIPCLSQLYVLTHVGVSELDRLYSCRNPECP